MYRVSFSDIRGWLIKLLHSKGLAIQYLTIKWGLDPRKILVAGDSGNDEEMLRGNNLGVIVANYSKELARLQGRRDIYFAQGAHAWGILEGMNYYDFLGNNSESHEPDSTTESQEQQDLQEQQQTNDIDTVTDA